MTRSLDRLAIIGAGGHGRVVADIAEQENYSEIVFLDPHYPERKENLDWQICGQSIDALTGEFHFFVAIGKCRTRHELLSVLMGKNLFIATLVHPSASVSRFAKIGAGSVIMPHAVVNAGADIGKGVIVNTAATIDHDCKISDGAHISPGVHIAGGVNVGVCSWIGIGSCVKENIFIGCDVTVGAGSVVVKNIAHSATVMGNPAREK